VALVTAALTLATGASCLGCSAFGTADGGGERADAGPWGSDPPPVTGGPDAGPTADGGGVFPDAGDSPEGGAGCAACGANTKCIAGVCRVAIAPTCDDTSSVVVGPQGGTFEGEICPGQATLDMCPPANGLPAHAITIPTPFTEIKLRALDGQLRWVPLTSFCTASTGCNTIGAGGAARPTLGSGALGIAAGADVVGCVHYRLVVTP